MTGRRFMDSASLWERQPFVSLGQTTPVVEAPAGSGEVTIVPPAPSNGSKIGTVLVTAGALFFASEVVGLTNLLGIRKHLK